MAVIPVRRDLQGRFLFEVNYDHTPEGFLDCIEDSTFKRLCDAGMALVEYGHPKVDDHADPRIVLQRTRQIFHDRVCGNIKIIHATTDGFIAEIVPHGPHQKGMIYMDGIKKLFVAPRLLFNVDSELVDIITFDAVESI